MIGYILAIAWKELQLMFKDKGALAVAFLLPLLIGSMFGGTNLMVEEGEEAILLHVSLVNEDKGVFGRNVANAITSIEVLDVEIFDQAAEAEAQVADGEATAAIILPADFTLNINAHTPTEIEVILDPGQPLAANIVTGIMNQVVDEVTIWGEVQYGIQTIMDEAGLFDETNAAQQRAVGAQTLGVIMTILNDMREKPAIAVIHENLEGVKVERHENEPFVMLVFAGYTVMFIFINVYQSAHSLLSERESGTLYRLLAAPLPRGTIIAGKMLAFIILPCLQVLVMLSAARIFFNLPLGQSPFGLVVLSLATALTSAAMGMMVAALARSARQATSIGLILGITLAALGGAIVFSATPPFRTEGIMGVLSRLTPHAHAVEGFFSLTWENATFFQVLPEIGILLGFGVLFFLVARWRFKYT